jgi:hypothetical protein
MKQIQTWTSISFFIFFGWINFFHTTQRLTVLSRRIENPLATGPQVAQQLYNKKKLLYKQISATFTQKNLTKLHKEKFNFTYTLPRFPNNQTEDKQKNCYLINLSKHKVSKESQHKSNPQTWFPLYTPQPLGETQIIRFTFTSTTTFQL